jgi:hypothetical protein
LTLLGHGWLLERVDNEFYDSKAERGGARVQIDLPPGFP